MILIVDTWSEGMGYVEPVIKRLMGYADIVFLHFNSLILPHTDQNLRRLIIERLAEHNNPTFNIADISDFSYSVDKALDSINPDVVVTISLHGFFQRWTNTLCDYKDIPTLMFMHGIKSESTYNTQTYQNPFRSVYRKAPRLILYLKAWMYYVRDLLWTGATLSKSDLLGDFVELIFAHSKYTYYPTHRTGLHYDTICTVTDSDKEYFMNNYRIYDAKYISVGHIDMSKVIDELQHVDSSESDEEAMYDHKKELNILFVSHPMTDKVVQRDYIYSVLTISEMCEAKNYNFCIRPHPRDSEVSMEVFRNHGLVLSSESLPQDLANADIIFGANSTVLVTAANLGLPVVAIGYKNDGRLEHLSEFNNVAIVNSDDISDFEVFCDIIDRVTVSLRSTNDLLKDLNSVTDPGASIAKEILNLIKR